MLHKKQQSGHQGEDQNFVSLPYTPLHTLAPFFCSLFITYSHLNRVGTSYLRRSKYCEQIGPCHEQRVRALSWNATEDFTTELRRRIHNMCCTLSIVGGSTVDCCPVTVGLFSTVHLLCTSFSASTHRWAELKTYLGIYLVLKSLSNARWKA
jgi:hypothetical protein